MVNAIDSCPTDQMLEMLAQNKLAAAEREALLQHLERCEACARRATSVPCHDTLVELVRQAGNKPAVADAGKLVEEICRLWPGAVADQETLNVQFPGEKATGGGQAPKAAVTMQADAVSSVSAPPGIAVYDFLAPPLGEDELGRLGPYRAMEVLGSGGMGVVFRAEDDMLRRQIALKVMLPGMAADPSGKQRFLREARSAAAVRHENVVTIYQVDEARGVPYLAMELLQGESLEKRLGQGAKLPLADVLRIGREVAEGLAAAHALGLVHRDIKPANIWLEAAARKAAVRGNPPPVRKEEAVSSPGSDPSPLTAAFRVKILDFGLACDNRADGRLTRKGVIVGTAAYMSPEQARGQTPDARGDLFSLGCVLYVMCTGKLPFPGTDFVSTLVSVVSLTPRHVKELEPSLPTEFANLVMQLLEKNPAARPQSAQEVAKKLAGLEKAQRALRKDRARKSDRKDVGSALSSKMAAQPTTPYFKRPHVLLGLAVLLAALSAGGAWLTMIVLRVQTPHGTVVIKTDDPNLQLKISMADKEVALIDLKNEKTGKQISLKVGKYDVELLNAKEGMKLRSRQFTIEDGKQSQIEVVFEPTAGDKDKDFRDMDKELFGKGKEPKDKGKDPFGFGKGKEPKDKGKDPYGFGKDKEPKDKGKDPFGFGKDKEPKDKGDPFGFGKDKEPKDKGDPFGFGKDKEPKDNEFFEPKDKGKDKDKKKKGPKKGPPDGPPDGPFPEPPFDKGKDKGPKGPPPQSRLLSDRLEATVSSQSGDRRWY